MQSSVCRTWHLSRLGAALTLLGAGFALPAAHAQTIFFDDFNTETPSLNYTGFANWNVNRGSVDLIGSGPNGTLADVYPGNGYYVDLDGSSNAAGLLQTKTAFALTPGSYTLSFNLGKNGSSLETMTVSVGSAFSSTVSNAGLISSFTPISSTFTVNAATTGAISFDHAGGDNAGFIIDNVLLFHNTAGGTAPEPSSFALVGTGVVPLAGVLLRRRSRRRRAAKTRA